MICPLPSAVTTTGAVTLATPDGLSVAVNETVTSVLFPPPAFGDGDTIGRRTGGVLSRLMATCAVAILPALSIAVPVMIWFAASVLTVTGEGQFATPLVLSKQVKLTTTLALYHPAALGGRSAEAVMVGGTLSTPRISSVKPLPGPLRSSTVRVFVACSV